MKYANENENENEREREKKNREIDILNANHINNKVARNACISSVKNNIFLFLWNSWKWKRWLRWVSEEWGIFYSASSVAFCAGHLDAIDGRPTNKIMSS